MNRYDSNASFVMNDQAPAVATPDTSLLKRQDIVAVTGQMIEAYQGQQRALLGRLQEDVVGGGSSGGFLSDADQVAERRKTSGLYLRTYLLVSALTTGGLAYLAHLAGAAQGASLAGWIAGTGALTLLLAWRRHGDEFSHSPEGIARHLLDWHGDIASYEAETRRKAIEWEHQAEERRQAAQERAAEHGRQLAQLRIDELDARRKAIEAQRAQVDPYEGRFRVQWGTESAQTVQAGQGGAPAALQVQSVDDDTETPTDGAAAGHWRDSLIVWLSTLYEPGATTETGIVKGRVPWAARSSWVEQDKAEARRVCVTMRPALIEQADGGRWRLRREVFTDVDQALQVLSPRLS